VTTRSLKCCWLTRVGVVLDPEVLRVLLIHSSGNRARPRGLGSAADSLEWGVVLDHEVLESSNGSSRPQKSSVCKNVTNSQVWVGSPVTGFSVTGALAHRISGVLQRYNVTNVGGGFRYSEILLRLVQSLATHFEQGVWVLLVGSELGHRLGTGAWATCYRKSTSNAGGGLVTTFTRVG